MDVGRRALIGKALAAGALAPASLMLAGCSSGNAEETIQCATDGKSMARTKNPLEFGALGDGVNDDTAAIQATYTSLLSEGGGAIVLPPGRYHIPGHVAFDQPGVSIISIGGAVLGGGELRVGPAEYANGMGGLDYSGDAITGLVFDQDDKYGSKRSLVLRNVRGLEISRNVFRSAGKAIAAEEADGNSKFHTTAMIQIRDNQFSGVMFGIYGDTSAWDILSDWHITDNYFNYCLDTSVWLACTDGKNPGGIDGLSLSGNTIFSMSHTARTDPGFVTKRYNIRLGETNWLRIVNNNFFEPGLSAVYLDNPRNFTFVGNHIAWPGQRKLGDALEIRNGSPVGVIEGNTFSMWTRAAIGLYDLKDFSRLEIGQNGWQWSESPTSWTGDEPLPGYRVFASGDGIGYPIVRDFQDTGAYDSLKGERRQLCRDIKTPGGGITGCYRRDIQIGDGTTIFNVSDIAGRSSFGGLISVTAMSTSDQALVASYLLFVSSQGSVCTVVESGGLTDGEDAEHPSFEWSLTDGALLARPVGNAAGTYNFDAVGIGTASPS